MRLVTLSRYFIPSTCPPGKIIASRYAMSPETAAELGAVGKVPGTDEVREIAETDTERWARAHKTP